MAAYRTLDGLEVAGRRVLLRLDLNVPVRDGRITDATRIERALPTLGELTAAGARVVVLSHFGRPKGKREPEMSLAPLAAALGQALGGRDVVFAEDCIGAAAEAAVGGLDDGEVALLENLRFHPGEEANDPAFADALATLGDLYVNDAFSAAHRAHASTAALAARLPAAAGRAMAAELEALEQALGAPKRPVTAVVGGAKVSTKLAVLANLAARVDHLAIGGAMANTFLLAQGHDVGTSLVEAEMTETALEVLAAAAAKDCEVILPRDVVVAHALSRHVDIATVVAERVPEGMMILDVGLRTVMDISDRLRASATLVWNGPLGAFETPPFDESTVRLAETAARLSREGRLASIAGGGDTVAALRHARAADDFSYVSTAGGAFLEWLEGKALPGVVALEA
ncbi:MAG: phosphoglycerate kinase [Alphaproteobacteria bacterium]|jgi:phosphoglycerate kinase|nr:phosphoglycerate kinase [Alphaproteobacteria bacterium]